MTDTNTSWEALQKRRTLLSSIRNSAHMLECMEIVVHHFPNAQIIQTGPEKWKLVDMGGDLSGEYNSHYACWLEARDGLNVNPNT